MRYWEIAQTLREEIAGGGHPLGGRLPTEAQLMQAYGVSRHAVREALRLLTEDGLISRRPRAGSTIVALEPQLHFVQRVASIQEIVKYPSDTERRDLSTARVTADAELAAVLRCAAGTPWFRFETIRFAAGSSLPLCHTHVYVRPEYAGIANQQPIPQITFAEQIAQAYGVHAAVTDFEILASLVPEASAAILKVSVGSAALTTIRRYTDADGRLFEVSVAVHPAPRYTLSFQLRREHANPRRRRA